MSNNSILAISPVDGRYSKQTAQLKHYFSEYALMKYRVKVEVEYFIALALLPLPQLKGLTKENIESLRTLETTFCEDDALAIKEIEKTTNHDVKAVEYFLKDRLKDMGISKELEFIHFGLTSQDINNTAIPLSLKDSSIHVIYPSLNQISLKLIQLAEEWKDQAMLAYTHGQPASPTRLGKEFNVFIERLNKQMEILKSVPFAAKFGGATGNFNAHHVAYPQIDWISFADKFVNENLGLYRSRYTTQIEHYDYLAAWFDGLKRINTILIDLSRDIWTYISKDYFKQRLKEGEIGSSAMPHKVNPIDFENAEGNLGVANALLEHFSSKLPISRLQRDLTDSTVLRNIGVPLAHSLIAYQSLLKGLDKLILNEAKINDDLENNLAVVAEAIQTILRREGYPKPYEALKELTRTNEILSYEKLHTFIDKLEISDEIKAELKRIRPENYTGL